jgi:prephenate dehydrogenase
MKIGIIGGAGKMGRCISALLEKDGFEVSISDKNREKTRRIGGVESSADLVRKCDLLLISLPLNSLEEAAIEISPYVKEGQTILDISSIKGFSLGILHEHLGKAVTLGVHPMFGPTVKSLKSENVILTPADRREEEVATKLGDYLRERGACVITLTPEEHDELMSFVLGLSHFVGLSVAGAISQKRAELEKVAGPSFRALMEFVQKVVSQDPAFYASLQMNLPGIVQIEDRFIEEAKMWREIVASGDEVKFIERMSGLKKL